MRRRPVVRLKAGTFLVFSCGVLALAGCVVGHVAGKPYSFSATKACLSGKAKLVSGGYFVVDSTVGGLEVRRPGHDLYLDFGMSPEEARGVAKEVKTHATYGSRTVATNGNVAYWTDDSPLT